MEHIPNRTVDQELDRGILGRLVFRSWRGGSAGICRPNLRAKRSVQEAGEEAAGLGLGGFYQARDDNRGGQQRERAVAEEP